MSCLTSWYVYNFDIYLHGFYTTVYSYNIVNWSIIKAFSPEFASEHYSNISSRF